MTTIRVAKDTNYTVISNRCINDPRISWRAKGLLIYLLSKPNDWRVEVADIIGHGPDGRDAVYSTLKELAATGYLERHQGIAGGGAFAGVSYTVHEIPIGVGDAAGSDARPPAAVPRPLAGIRPTPLRPSRTAGERTAKLAAVPPRHLESAEVAGKRARDLDRLIATYPAHRVVRRDLPAIGGEWETLCVEWDAEMGDAPVPAIDWLLADLAKRTTCHDWTKDGGRFVPSLLRYLGERLWNQQILPAPSDNRPRSQADWNSPDSGTVVI